MNITPFIKLAIASSAGNMLLKIPGHLKTWVYDTFTVEIKVSQEAAYAWLHEWLITQDLHDGARKLEAQEFLYTDILHDHVDKLQNKVVFLPGKGNHLINVEGRWVLITRSTGTDGVNNITDLFTAITPPAISLRTMGRDAEFLKDLITGAETSYRKSRSNKLNVYATARYGGWEQVSMVEPRPWNSVILREGLKENLLQDAETFRANRNTYIDLGIPYRRGYLLHGIPGCGKSSLVKALSSKLGLSLYIQALSSGVEDAMLLESMRHIPNNAVVLLEDVECVYGEHKTSGNKLTRTGLLNALDGITTGEGHLVFLTTNFRDTLDDALIRPGRVDLEVELLNTDSYQAEALTRKFLPTWMDGQVDSFVNEHAGLTPAELQGKLLSAM